MISPAEFIPPAEETGLIGELSWIVLEGTCRLLGSGRAPDLRSVSINLSMQQFAEQELISRIVDSLDRNGVPHDRLKVEITERVLLQDMDRMRTAMAEMASRDIHFYQSWRKAPAFRHGDISHTLLPRKEILRGLH